VSARVSRRAFLGATGSGLVLACGDDGSPAATPSSNTRTAGSTQAPGASGAAATQAPMTWASRAPLPTPRSEVASAVLDGKIYVIGGFVASGQTSNVLEVYDPVTDRWERRAPMPQARDHAMAAALNGRVFVVGGGLGGPLREGFSYEPTSDRWTAIADMPHRRTSGGAATLNGRIIVAGGVGDSPLATMIYNMPSNTWSEGPPLPAPREHLAVAFTSNAVYVVGGRWDGVLKDTNEVLEGLNGRWRALPPMPTARGGTSGSAVNGGRIAVAGGEAFTPNRTFPQVEVFDPAANAWTAAPRLPTPRHGLAVQGVGGTLYVIGGGPTAGLSVAPQNEALRLG
jgi:N-acetylneuraminic acid mutarotase